ncbi:bifunctional diguanylate cyclase/phosphodiesterase [Paenibacillus puerhi]|uniref:bifunctional diguanylate cyclase/phosphodiesterase n=1 Tax=Paenibacillus puerhi TaxID=2692622 RepID=UPI0013576ADD|nr:GGDEF domain-containing protein [Paenibacillus puerhi]
MAAQRGWKESTDELTLLREELEHIIQQQSIRSVYQPIVSLRDGEIAGYEALTRGPEDSRFRSPLPMFSIAEQEGLLYPLDRLARAKAIEGVRLNHEKQLLFINVSAEILNDPLFAPGKTLELLTARGLRPSNVVFEITERSSIEDFASAKRVLDHYRQQGYRIAIDDAGAGYSSLQAIAELGPDYIKADKSLIAGMHRSKSKEYILETLVTFADKLGIYLIAEGIESPDELMKLTRMGVHYGQGYLLGRPSAEKPIDIPQDIRRQIVEHRSMLDWTGHILTIGELAAPSPTFEAGTPISLVANYFKSRVEAQGAVVVKEGRPVGLIMRERLFQQLAGQYGYSLFWNRPIDQLMDDDPLIVDEGKPVELVSKLATSRDSGHLYDLVIITSNGQMHGMASVRTILECITNAKMENAKVANPLTGLPGNLQINREIKRRLASEGRFSVIYADLDFFKWYNDRYGFHKGDQLIQFTADCIQYSIQMMGSPYDFVGHIGGDDFIAITACPDSERLCQEMIRRFDAGVSAFYEVESWTYVEDRHGNKVDSDGVTLSLSLVVCESGRHVTPEQISLTAARLKKKSKAHRGSVVFCDQAGECGAACWQGTSGIT